jgi:hypothetical protein
LNGTEIILEITDVSVKIQLVSGESELNYFIGGDQKVDELDLGSVSIYPWDPNNDLHFHFAPVYLISEDLQLNGGPVTLDGNPYFMFYMQPYLWYIIELIVKKLGYNIKSNEFNSSWLKYIYVVNGKFTFKYADVLPNWTVKDFFNELEKLFNIVFIIDEYSKEVNILLKSQFYQIAKKYCIDKVLDNFSQKIDEENKQDYAIGNVGYELMDDEYFNFQNLSSEILEHTQSMTFSNFNSIKSYINSTSDKDSIKNIIFHDEYTNTDYICYHGVILGADGYYPNKVNAFRPIINNIKSSNIDIQLRISPAAMVVKKVPVKQTLLSTAILYELVTQMPAIPTGKPMVIGQNPIDDQFIDIQETIEEELDIIKKESNDQMYIAIYTGEKTIYEEDMEYATTDRKANFPVPFVDFLWEFNRIDSRKIDEDNHSLRLDHQDGLKSLYSQSDNNFDTTKEYTFKFMYAGKLDVKNIFIINNKEFFCKEIRRVVNIDGFEKVIEGDFYAKIN